jgi:flavorubredoxin
MIAPSHGPIHNEVTSIIDRYTDWVSDSLQNSVVLAYVSMHGSTEAMANHLTEMLVDKGIRVDRFNLAVSDLGKIAMALVDAATIIVGSPTILAGAHPQVVPAVFLVNAMRPKLKFASVIGSYGWGGKTVEQISSLVSNLKLEILEPVMALGYPKEADFKALDRLANDIFEKHREAGII